MEETLRCTPSGSTCGYRVFMTLFLTQCSAATILLWPPLVPGHHSASGYFCQGGHVLSQCSVHRHKVKIRLIVTLLLCCTKCMLYIQYVVHSIWIGAIWYRNVYMEPDADTSTCGGGGAARIREDWMLRRHLLWWNFVYACSSYRSIWNSEAWCESASHALPWLWYLSYCIF